MKKNLWRAGWWGLLIVALLGAFACLVVGVWQNWWNDLDQTCGNAMGAMRNPAGNIIAIIITNCVNPIVLAGIGLALLFFAKKQRGNTLLWCLNLALSAVINVVIKNLIGRARPDLTLSVITASGYSFPSGHAMAAVASYGFLIYMVWQTDWPKWTRWLATAGSVITILLIGWSRIYLGVHYLTDILAGYVLATLLLLMFLFIVMRGRQSLQMAAAVGYKKHGFLMGFKYAVVGIITAFQNEFNLTIQFACAMLAVVFGICLQISALEWCLIVVMCVLVMTLELVNTALENLGDKMTLEQDSRIKYVKDVAAGAVLLAAIGAVIVGAIIFLPKILLAFL